MGNAFKNVRKNSRQAREQGKWLVKKMYQYKDNVLIHEILIKQVEDELFYAKKTLMKMSSASDQKALRRYIINELKLKDKSQKILSQ